jgi:HlyD family secretion protein
MAKKWLIGCGIPTILVVPLVYFGAKAYLKPKPKTERSETVTRGDVEIKVVETGTIEPLRKVEVKSKAGGRVVRLHVDEGAVVQAGQILATIDAEEVNSQVAALREQLIGSKARLEAARKGTTFQESQTQTGIAQYIQSVESAKARLRMAEEEAKAQPELTQRGIEIAQANLDAAKAQLKVQQDSLQLMLDSTHPQAVVNAQATYDRLKSQADNAERNAERQKQLLAKGFVSQQAADNAKTDAEVAETQVREAKQRLDRIKQTNALEQANARSQVVSAQSSVRQMEAALAQAKRGVLPSLKLRELENARASLAQAQAQLAAARSNKTQDLMRRDEADASEAGVRQLEKQLEELLVRQKDTTLYASRAGVVTKRYVEEGEIITSAVSSFSSGTPVFQIADLGTMVVKINVNEVDIAKVRQGLPTEVRIDASKKLTLAGHVRKVAPAALGSASATSEGSGGGRGGGGGQAVVRFPVEVQIDRADPRLKPGMSARCSIFLSRRRNVMRVPINCVKGEGKTVSVQIVTETQKEGLKVETATPRQVTVGLHGDDFVEIVSGLKEGEKVRPYPYTGPPRKTIEVNMGPD